MADEFTRTILENWGFENLIPSFEEQEISEQSLLLLESGEISQLIPKIGRRLIFEKRLNALKLERHAANSETLVAEDSESQAGSSSGSTLNLSQCSADSDDLGGVSNSWLSEKRMKLNPISIFNFKLTDLLKETFDGKMTVAQYQDKSFLDEKCQKVVTEVVIKHMMKTSQLLHSCDFDYAASEIVNAFPNESKGVYFVAGLGQRLAKGKLVNFYHNLRKNYLKCGVISSARKSPGARKSPEVPKSNSCNDQSTDPECEVNEDFIWLRNNCVPFEEVFKKWKQTSFMRDFRHEKFQDVVSCFQEWPVLKLSNAHVLLDHDFNLLYPGKDNALLSKWELVSDNLFSYMKNYIKDGAYKRMLLTDFDSMSFSTNYKDAAILLSLAACIHPTYVRKNKNSNKLWKPTVIESQEGMIAHIKEPADIELTLKEKKMKIEKLNLPLQPLILFVGEFEEGNTREPKFYVSVHETLYEVPTAAKAIDCCFKVYQVLHLEYPPECSQIWSFFQFFFYDINTQWDRVSGNTLNFISKIKASK